MSSGRARSRSRSFRRAARLHEVEEAAIFRRGVPEDAGFWLPMLSEGLFGVAPVFGDLRHAWSLRRLSRLLSVLTKWMTTCGHILIVLRCCSVLLWLFLMSLFLLWLSYLLVVFVALLLLFLTIYLLIFLTFSFCCLVRLKRTLLSN